MSDSRLEKFIYAICSMDVTDLPVPLSRIEKLWNCLITGETPDFEPQSRNEKYLMAMLGRYDISNLPAPMSRGEKLLYKIAVGETDLSDVPGYLSRYEELLKYLIENGGISGGDFEYVLYTLNQSLSTLYTTAEKPVKSAILKGQTLVNISMINKFSLTDGNKNVRTYGKMIYGKKYLQIIAITKNTMINSDNNDIAQINAYEYNSNHNFDVKDTITSGFIGVKKLIGMASRNGKRHDTSVRSYSNSVGVLEGYEILIEYQEGMENWDIPYFTGMQSVKMPVLTTIGKNLFDGEIEEGQFDSNGNPSNDVDRTRSKNFIKVPKNTDLYISMDGAKNASWTTIYFYNDKKEHTNTINTVETNKTFNTKNNSYIKWKNNSQISQITNVQIEQGTAATSYEPFKSNILTVNEPIELRGIGDVQDTLDCLTGEVVERIGEIMLNESLNYQGSSSANGENTMYFQLDLGAYPNSIPVSSHFKVSSANLYVSTNDYEGIRITGNGSLQLRVLKSKLNSLDVKGLKEYLKQNNISLQYQLATESIKTVDLTVVDQDNKPTRLGTFENITHVSLESAGLIPEVKMEVATRISKELASASPLMDDISTKQEQSNTTVDEQSNNVDATMIATTEIYEETL